MTNAFDRLRSSLLLILVLPVLVLVIASAGWPAYGQDVVLYDQANYGGAAKHVGVTGVYRFTSAADFNDRAMSIKVPHGLVAVVYTDADDHGGYGNYLDLMEDCPDLTRYNLARKISFVQVFSSTKPGSYWARNANVNGVFVAGHWERSRIGGINVVNPVAVVGPALPPNDAVGVTKLHKDGPTTIIDNLGVQSPGFAAKWMMAVDDQMGVIGSDFDGPEPIGSAAFERASNNAAIPDSINFWYPQKRPTDNGAFPFFKRTLVGTIAPTAEGVLEGAHGCGTESDSESEPHIAEVNGTYEDHDVNVDVIPDPKYQYLITDAHKPDLSLQQSAQLTYEDGFLRLIADAPHCKVINPCTRPFRIVETEIDSDASAKAKLAELLERPLTCDQGCAGDCAEKGVNTPAYKQCVANCKQACKSTANPSGGRVGKKIAMYGPWIYDKGHCYHPEIHPAEQIWWSEAGANDSSKYYLNVFSDASGRFWWRDQMDDGTKLKPWGAPPIKGTFAIAFEAQVGKPGSKFEVSNQTDATGQSVDYNVAEYLNADQVYNLIYGGNVLVSFIPHNNSFIAFYDKVGLKPGTNNVVRGFLVLKTAVGTLTQKRRGELVCPNGPRPVFVREGADPNDIDQCVERFAFEKVEGHYMFTVLKTPIH